MLSKRDGAGEIDRAVRSAGHANAGQRAIGQRRAVAGERAVEVVEPHAACRAGAAVPGQAVAGGERRRGRARLVSEMERVAGVLEDVDVRERHVAIEIVGGRSFEHQHAIGRAIHRPSPPCRWCR